MEIRSHLDRYLPRSFLADLAGGGERQQVRRPSIVSYSAERLALGCMLYKLGVQFIPENGGGPGVR
jgi:hypothetical protein